MVFEAHCDKNSREMASSVVFIFLLDHLPGKIPFEPLDTLPVSYSGHTISRIIHCDHIMNTEPILQMISQVMKVKVIPKWRNHENFTHLHNKHRHRDMSIETNDIEPPIDNSAGDLLNGSFEETHNFVDEDYLEHLGDDKSECEYENTCKNKPEDTKHFYNGTEESFPKTAPFLVSIFESLSNVTAQTCGGALVSPHWVLTVASCVNVLRKLFNNISETSKYTVIVNASNPFLDGSGHNVTEIFLHPQPGSSADILGLTKQVYRAPMQKDLVNTNDVKSPALALMRVEPAMEVDPIGMLEEKLEKNAAVMVYGWQLVKNDTGHDAMHVTSFPATALASACTKHGVANETMCLATIANNTAQISLGGIVVTHKDDQPVILGFAQAEDHASFTALPLSPHAAWINSVLDD